MYVLLFILIGVAIVGTWIVPSGKFATVRFDQERALLIVAEGTSERTLPATQQSLSSLHVQTPIETLTKGATSRAIPIPGTYEQVRAEPQGPLTLLTAPIQGIVAAADVCLFILIIGGFIGLFNQSGAFDAGISALAARLRGREHWLIVALTTLFAIGGTTEGMAEETIAFYPLLAPIFIRAGYDRIVPLAVIMAGSQMGCLGGTVNPFAVILASAIIGVPWTEQLAMRALVWVLATSATIGWTLWYAQRVRRVAARSLAPAPGPESEEVPALVDSPVRMETVNASSIDNKSKVLLLLFGLTFALMIAGVSRFGWWFPEMCALFLGSAIVAALIQGGERQSKIFFEGAGELLGVAALVGLARAVTVTLEAGHIDATIVQAMTSTLAGTPSPVFLGGTFLLFVLIGFVNTSSTGVAALTMPLLGPAAAAVGVGGASVVSAYVFGQNVLQTVAPTGPIVLPSLAMMGVRYSAWLRFVVPLIIIVGLMSLAVLLAFG
jgi:uncharacterized ion transporter superfamily protein YfcC